MPVHASINPLEWETEFFGIESAILHISVDAPELRAEELASWERVQVKIPAQRTDWLDTLQQLGFQLVEGEVDFKLDVTRGTAPLAQIAVEDDIPRLRELAAQVFSQSRFRAPWYDAEASGRFYAQWIENAVRGTFDHQCLVFRDNGGDIRAFVSLRQLNASEARIGLLAGRGAGEILMQTAVHWAYERQLTTLWVGTQISNTAAIKRYMQSGATLESTAYWLYR